MYKKLVELRSVILVFLTHNMALPLLKIFRRPQKFPFSADELRSLPCETIGRQLIDMLDKKQLKLLPYYARHDIKHILLEYDTTDEGEVCLQTFMLGNRHWSFPVIATVLYGFATMPEHWNAFKKAYARGKACPDISQTKWFEVLNVPTASLQEKFQLQNSFHRK